ncbi:MAG: carbamate kinase [bacterium]
MPVAVVAVGGNSLMGEAGKESVPDQYSAAVKTMKHVAGMIEKGWDVVMAHGNGPQVGFILLRAELAKKEAGLHSVPLDSCVADTQGAIGYNFQQILGNEFERRGIDKEAVTVVTRVLVDNNDPAFKNPTKPIGPFMEKEEAEQRRAEDGWDVVEDAGRGYRRVVPSPDPKEILEQDSIEALINDGKVVIAVGGGGIPVYRRDDGIIAGLEAVIDKDFASALLAKNINADLFMISTAVDRVCLNFDQPDEQELDKRTVAEAQQYIDEGHFAPGSMLPKIEAVIRFLESGGKRAIITSPANLASALDGDAGTEIVAG